MSRYMVDKALWRYGREVEFRSAFEADPAAALAGFELTAAERAALAQGDIRAIFTLGAHPFLIYSFAIARNGGWSFDLMRDYVARLEGLSPGDIET